VSASDALKRLRDGNRRFVGRATDAESGFAGRNAQPSARSQSPLAIILGCSDARVPAEMVFDQGLGDLFVIRIAGNIVAPSQIGSVEFAAVKFGTRLVVVLGHSQCGAVDATVQALLQPSESQSRNLSSIVDRIRPHVQSLLENDPGISTEELVEQAVRANVRASTMQLRNGSAILEDLVANHGLRIVAAEYCLESGQVDFLDSVE